LGVRKIILVAWREYIETVRTKTFFVSVFLLPALILFFVFGAERLAKLAEAEKLPPRRLAVLDESGRVFDALQQEIEAYNQRNPNRPFALEQLLPQAFGGDLPASSPGEDATAAVRSGTLYGFLRIPAEVLVAGSSAACELLRRDQQLAARRDIEQMLNRAIQIARFRSVEPPIDPGLVARLQQEVPLIAIDARTLRVGRDDTVVRLLTPFGFMFLLFMGTMQISYGLLTSLLEEKSSRVIEVLLSALSPLQLMAGKILGMAAVGFTLLLIWVGVGYQVAQARGYDYLISRDLLFYAGLYFVPGFLLLSSLLAAVGSACNTLKEAQSMASPITIVTVVPMILWFSISQNPGSTFATALSYIPPITPFVMILRICADPDVPIWEIVATQILLWLSVAGAIWVAARIFRVGILMYGKPPTPRELLRWLGRA
jgi:ABC-2 type transport system permease protein